MVAGQLRVGVHDTGIGIAVEDVAKVFEEFGQVDGSTTRRHEGTGLGVPLSKRLVESHGGRMWLESQPGAGSSFYFTLPVSAPVLPGPGQFAAGPWAVAPSYRKALLVLAPDPLLLNTIRRHLSDFDVIEVEHAAAVAAAVERYQPVALVVSSQADSARETWGIPDDLPVVSVALLGNLAAAQALGVENYLTKPVLREQLLDAIAALGREVRDVLIVDDEPDLVELLARMLQSVGEVYRPLRAHGGVEALARLRSQPVDLVLLDVRMPEVDGLAVLREMKSDPALATVPVIIISAELPETAPAEGGLHVQLTRAASPSTTETLTYLQVLVEALPPRGLPATAAAPARPAIPDDQPAS
jgi:CheY-like chemotaxis protein